MDLDKIRQKVDAIDAEVLGLLNRRMELTVCTRNLKQQTSDSQREERVMENIASESRGLLTADFSKKLFREVINESKRLQEAGQRLVGFQGEHGAYGEIAAGQYDGKAVAIPHQEFVEIFESVKVGSLDRGIVPVENSLGGNVGQVDDLLIENDLFVVAEVKLPVRHCLISLPNTNYRDIRVVYSHPQALSQCRGFIARHNLEARPYYDTAGAAMMLARQKLQATAVISSDLCAPLYNLSILKENIEDDGSNFTRFLVLAKEPASEPGNKCSIVFSTAHEPGVLFKVLGAFSEAKINLTRIESRPLAKQPGMYGFLLDFLGSDKDENVQRALENVKKEAGLFKFLGCYQKAAI